MHTPADSPNLPSVQLSHAWLLEERLNARSQLSHNNALLLGHAASLAGTPLLHRQTLGVMVISNDFFFDAAVAALKH